MSENETLPQIDLSAFALADRGSVSIEMPSAPAFEEKDIDAQLFSYVAQAEKGARIHSIADLDDAWVQANFPDVKTVVELREVIRRDLERERDLGLKNVRFQRCADALVARLEGELSEEVIAAYAKASRAQYAERLAAAGMGKHHYMQQMNMSESEFEEKLLEDVVFQLKLNIALDLLAQEEEAVADDELTSYLSVADPDTFLDEARATGKLDEARQAAMRVKVMRGVVASAVVAEEA